MNSENRNPYPDEVWDLVPTCRFMDNCDQLLIGCNTCDYMNPDLLRDEDGEPLRVSEHPEFPTT